MTCSVTGCDRTIKNKSHQLCDPHYKRVWRTGNTGTTPILAPRRRPEAAVDFEDGTRECQNCKARLGLDMFHNDTKSPLGKRKTCKGCRVALETTRYHSDPAGYSAKVRAFRINNLEHVRAREVADYEKHRTARVAAALVTHHERRARMLARPVDRGISIKKLRARDGDACCYCSVTMIFQSFPAGERDSRQATLEHRQPISKGGSHTWDNLALACWRCNISKGAKTLDEWMPDRPAATLTA